MYAGGKYDNGGDNYEVSLGLTVSVFALRSTLPNIWRQKFIPTAIKYTLHFERAKVSAALRKKSMIKRIQAHELSWKPDLDVFTDINIPIEYFQETIKRQAIVNDGVKFILQKSNLSF